MQPIDWAVVEAALTGKPLTRQEARGAYLGALRLYRAALQDARHARDTGTGGVGLERLSLCREALDAARIRFRQEGGIPKP